MGTILQKIASFIEAIFTAVTAYLFSLICPIENYLRVIVALAVINIIVGLIADHYRFRFKKAFDAIKHLMGYSAILLMAAGIGELMMGQKENVVEFISWITWVMIYFYIANILRNWNQVQPENKVVKFLYWVFSFKVVENIKYLKEYTEYQEAEKIDENGKE